MELEWDQRKAVANLRKHGVDFADAATVLHDDHATTVPDERSDEERLVTIGMDALGRLLVVVYTWREDPFVSSPHDRRCYAKDASTRG